MKKFAVIIGLLILISSPVWARPKRETPQKAAVEFAVSLGKSQFDKSWLLITDHSKKRIAQLAIERFEDLDDRIYTLDSMIHMIQTNEDGHRTVMFEDLRKIWCGGIGVKPKDLTGAKAELIKGNQKEALVKITVSGRSATLKMINESDWKDQWKVAWYPK